MIITRAQTRAALVDSIEHWRKNETEELVRYTTAGADSCSLCQLFDHYMEGECSGCPVDTHSGSSCRGTPYAAALRAHGAWKSIPDLGAAKDAFRIAAKVEREFLEMLLAKHDAEESAQ